MYVLGYLVGSTVVRLIVLRLSLGMGKPLKSLSSENVRNMILCGYFFVVKIDYTV